MERKTIKFIERKTINFLEQKIIQFFQRTIFKSIGYFLKNWLKPNFYITNSNPAFFHLKNLDKKMLKVSSSYATAGQHRLNVNKKMRKTKKKKKKKKKKSPKLK